MKKCLFILSSLTALLSAKSPRSSDDLIKKSVSKATPHVVAALKLASDTKANFAPLATKLSALGFGQAPPPHPMHAKSEKEEKDLTPEEKKIHDDHKQERAARMAQMGKADIKHLKSLDLNSDLKLEANEIKRSLQNTLKTALEDALKVDQNGDRKLTLKEYALAVPVRGEIGEDGVDWHQRGHFEHGDSNGDKVIDEGEIINEQAANMVQKSQLLHLALHLAGLDKDGDDVISSQEFKSIKGDHAAIWKKMTGEQDKLKASQIWPRIYWLSSKEITLLLNQ